MPDAHSSVDTSAALAFREIRVQRGDGFGVAVPDLSLEQGAVAALVGPSGCGKATLLWGLLGLVPDVRMQGDCEILGRPWPERGSSAGRGMLAGAVTIVMQDAKAAALGLHAEHLDKTAQQLSAGERRRAALLRALSVKPSLLTLDEPTASLDPAAALAVMHQLMEIQGARGLTCLWITHDRHLADGFAHRVLEMREGRMQ